MLDKKEIEYIIWHTPYDLIYAELKLREENLESGQEGKIRSN